MGLKASVLMRCYNQEDYIGPILQAFNQQTCSKEDFEVVFVDDGSEDSSINFFLNEKYSFNKKLVACEHEGRASALNRGIRECNGDIIIFIDGDCIPSKDFVQQHLKYYDNNCNVAVNGWTSIIRNIINSREEFEKLKDYIEYYKNIDVSEIVALGWPYRALEKPSEFIDFSKVEALVDNRKNIRFTEIMDAYGEDLSGCHIPWAVSHTANYSARKENLLKLLPIPTGFNASFEDWYISLKLYMQGIKLINSKGAKNYHQNHPRNKAIQKERHANGMKYLLKEFPIFEVLCIDGYYDNKYSFIEFSDLVGRYKQLKNKEENQLLFVKLDEIIIELINNKIADK